MTLLACISGYLGPHIHKKNWRLRLVLLVLKFGIHRQPLDEQDSFAPDMRELCIRFWAMNAISGLLICHVACLFASSELQSHAGRCGLRAYINLLIPQ